jgi:hypothetical protein
MKMPVKKLHVDREALLVLQIIFSDGCGTMLLLKMRGW